MHDNISTGIKFPAISGKGFVVNNHKFIASYFQVNVTKTIRRIIREFYMKMSLEWNEYNECKLQISLKSIHIASTDTDMTL